MVRTRCMNHYRLHFQRVVSLRWTVLLSYHLQRHQSHAQAWVKWPLNHRWCATNIWWPWSKWLRQSYLWSNKIQAKNKLLPKKLVKTSRLISYRLRPNRVSRPGKSRGYPWRRGSEPESQLSKTITRSRRIWNWRVCATRLRWCNKRWSHLMKIKWWLK